MLLLSVLTLFPQLGRAQGRSDRAWQNEVFLYGMATSIGGDARFGRVEQPVDVSFSEILDNLEMAFMGGYRGSAERFSVVADVVFLGLGKSHDTGEVRRADLDQLIVDITGAYRFSPVLEAFAGVRVTDLSTKVGLGEPLRSELEGSDTFYDPIIGARIRTPLSQNGRWWLQARGDIGGFGASMDSTWQAMANIGFKPADWISLFGGYRALGQDFKDTGGSEKFGMHITYQGPREVKILMRLPDGRNGATRQAVHGSVPCPRTDVTARWLGTAAESPCLDDSSRGDGGRRTP